MRYIIYVTLAGILIYISPRLLINYLLPLFYSCSPIEIVPGVYKIDGPRASSKNVYIVTDGPLTIIDPGIFYSPRCVMKSLEKLGYRLKDIKFIVITHYHIDHSGFAGQLRDLSGAKVIAGYADIPYIEGSQSHSFPRAPWLLRAGLALVHALMHDYKCEVDVSVKEGDHLPIFSGAEVIATPGHTPGSVSLLCQGKSTLFSGDALQYSGGELTRAKTIFSTDLAADTASILRIASLQFQNLLPGDGQPLIGNASSLARDYAAGLCGQNSGGR